MSEIYYGVICLACGPQQFSAEQYSKNQQAGEHRCPSCGQIAPFDEEEHEASKEAPDEDPPIKDGSASGKPETRRGNRRARMEADRQSAFTRCAQLVEKKGKDYGHWTEYHPLDVAGVNGVKAKRIRELTMQLVSNPDEFLEANEPLEDSILDAMNYLSFLYALVRETKAQVEPLEDE